MYKYLRNEILKVSLISMLSITISIIVFTFLIFPNIIKNNLVYSSDFTVSWSEVTDKPKTTFYIARGDGDIKPSDDIKLPEDIILPEDDPRNTDAANDVNAVFMNGKIDTQEESKFFRFSLGENGNQKLEYKIEKQYVYEAALIFFGLITLIFIVIVLFINILAKKITTNFVKPFNSLNFKEGDNLNADEILQKYPELTNFFIRIKSQDKLRQQFTENVAHEFRTPLAKIIRTLSVMKRAYAKSDYSGVESATKTIYEITKDNEAVIDTLLNFAKIEDGEYKKTVSKVDIKKEINDLIKDKKEIFNIEIKSDKKELIINNDRFLIREVLKIVLDNAEKYAKTFRNIEIEKNDKVLSFKLTNDVLGDFAQEDISRWTERFYRGNNSKKVKGTGIGLNLAKQMLKAVQSELNIQLIAKNVVEISFELTSFDSLN